MVIVMSTWTAVSWGSASSVIADFRLCASRWLGMATFSVDQWLEAYKSGQSGRPATMSRPEEVTCWTKTGVHDSGGRFLFGDRSGLPTYSRPQLPVNLNEGFPAAYTPKPEGAPSPVDTIIEAARSTSIDWTHFDVCTYRNNMNKILMTPTTRDAWALDCCFDSRAETLFLDIVPGPPATFRDAEKFTYYGYKFEAVCTGQSHVDATSEYGVVVTYRLGRLQVLMAAEVDAQLPGGQDGPTGGQPYVEMKTYTIPRHQKATADMYTVKHPRWWVQSYLAGVPTMVLGGRDQGGNLIKVQEVPVQALPGLSASASCKWDPQQLLSFGEALLVWLQSIAKQHPDEQLHCSFDPNSRSIHCEVIDGDMPDRLQRLLVDDVQTEEI